MEQEGELSVETAQEGNPSENLQKVFRFEEDTRDDNDAMGNKERVLKRLASSDSQGSDYGGGVTEDFDASFRFHGSRDLIDDLDDLPSVVEEEVDVTHLTYQYRKEASFVEHHHHHHHAETQQEAEEVVVNETATVEASAEVGAPVEEQGVGAACEPEPEVEPEPVGESEPARESEAVESEPPGNSEPAREPAREPAEAPIAPPPDIVSPSGRPSKPVRISEAKLYAKLNDKTEPVTPAPIDTGRGKENSVRSSVKVLNKNFTMATPENPGESTSDIKSWIKSTVSSKKIQAQKKEVISASRDSLDEDSGEMKRRSWSYRKTPESTPDKAAVAQSDSFRKERPLSQSLTPTSSAKIKSAMKTPSGGDSDSNSLKRLSGSKLRFADRPLPSPRSEYATGDDSAGPTDENTSQVDISSPPSFKKSSFSFDIANEGLVSPLSTPGHHSASDADASSEDGGEAGESSEASPGRRAARKAAQEAERSSSSSASALRSRGLGDRPLPAEPTQPRETYDRSKLRTVQVEKKETKKVEEEVVEEEVVEEEKKPIVIVFHPIKHLQECNRRKQFDGLLVGTLEAHLTDDDFKKHFGVKREDYYQQPQWKQHDRKKRLGLF